MRTRFPLTRLVLIFILTLAIASPAWPNSKAYAQSNGVQGGPDTISAQDEIKADIPSFRQSDYPEIAVDAQGSIHAIWRDKPADVLDIMYSIKPAGGSWSEPVNITHNVSPALSYGARTVVDARGDIHVVVVSSDTPSANTELYYMTKPAHGGWSKAVNITNTAGCSYAPAIAVDAQNGLHVIWIDNTSGTDRGYYITKPSGGSWSIPAVISNGPGNSEQAAIAVDVQGNLHLTWYTNSSIPSKVDIIYGTRSAGGSWSKPSNISDNSGRSELPTIAVDVQGNVYVVWEDNTSGNYGILYATKSAGGSWSMPLNISRSSGTSHSPAMATDAHGTLHAAWVDGTSGNQEIMYATKPAGGSWSEPANISNNTGGSYSPAISVDIQDNVCVIWVEFVHGVHSVLFATKPAGGSWSGSPVNSHSTTTPPLTSSAVASQMPDVGAVVVNASSLAAEKAFGVVASLALDASGGGSSTYSIAASNATKTERAHADYVCSGANDRAVLNRVIALTSAKGAGIMLSSGTFNVNNWIVNKPVTIIGQGASTVIKNPDAVSHVLTRTANSGQKIVTLSSHAGIAVGDHVFFCTSGHSRIESNRVVAISGNTLTMESPLTNTY